VTVPKQTIVPTDQEGKVSVPEEKGECPGNKPVRLSRKLIRAQRSAVQLDKQIGGCPWGARGGTQGTRCINDGECPLRQYL